MYSDPPLIVVLCIQEGWVLVGVKDTYLFKEKASDLYVGCCARCLDQLKKGFAVSQPYFDFIGLYKIEKLDRNRQILQFL